MKLNLLIPVFSAALLACAGTSVGSLNAPEKISGSENSHQLQILLPAPSILTQPVSQTVYAINTVTLNVGASSPATLSYQWQARPVGSGTFTNLPESGQLVGTTSNLLTLVDANTNATLDYRVIVANSYGAVTSAVATVTLQGGWQLVWSDDFKGTNLDGTKWSAYYGNDTGGQNIYTSRTNNVYVANGALHLVAQKDGYSGHTWSSGQVRTEFLYSKKYGRIEARMKLPAGQGFWPAFWMLGTNYDPGANWPTCGEIDVLENAGGATDRGQGTLHYPDANKRDVFANTTLVHKFPSGTDTTSFHTYAVQWSSNAIIWQIDGQNLVTWTNLPNSGLTYPAPFNQPFFFLLQLAVCATNGYGGPPNDGTPFPSEVQVDYVRVYDLPKLEMTLSRSKTP